jgi:hypothetical protein
MNKNMTIEFFFGILERTIIFEISFCGFAYLSVFLYLKFNFFLSYMYISQQKRSGLFFCFIFETIHLFFF